MIRGCSYRQQKTSKPNNNKHFEKSAEPQEPASFICLPPVPLLRWDSDSVSRWRVQCYRAIILKMIPKSCICSSTKPPVIGIKPPLPPCFSGWKKKKNLLNSFICPQRRIWAGIWHQWRGLCQMWVPISLRGWFTASHPPFSPHILPTWKGQGLLGSRAGV